ncbi:MAG TPA: hypothetical protein PKE12_06405 [Kiritimatiellia bacterium]|nr:hypothetical protein [Kiritimatiellia bacterium]
MQIALLAAVAFFLIAFLRSQDGSVFWSPDEGGKFLQMRAMEPTFHRSPPKLPYGGYETDPHYLYYPLGTVYPKYAKNGRYIAGWPPVFPWLSGWCYRLFGVGGLYFLPVLGTLLISWSTIRLASGTVPVWLLALILVFMASPVQFYGVLFWEHNLAVGLVMSSMVLYRFHFSFAGCMACLVMTTLGVIMRPEVALIVLCIPLAYAVSSARDWLKLEWKHFALILIALLLILWTLDSWTGGKILASKIHDLRIMIHRQWLALRPSTYLKIAENIMVNNPSEYGLYMPPYMEVCMSVGLLLVLLSVLGAPMVRLAAFSIGVALLAAVTLWAALRPERYRALHALFIPVPWWSFFLWLFRDDNVDYWVRGLPRLLVTLIVLFFLAALLTDTTHGGPEWGTRYLLIFYPLAAVGAAFGFDCAWRRYTHQLARCLLAILIVFSTATAGMITNRGLREIRRTKSDLNLFQIAIKSAGIPVVTDLWWLPAAMPDTFSSLHFSVVTDTSHLLRWYDDCGQNIPVFTYMSYTSVLVHDLLRLRHVDGHLVDVIHGMQLWSLHARGVP